MASLFNTNSGSSSRSDLSRRAIQARHDATAPRSTPSPSLDIRLVIQTAANHGLADDRCTGTPLPASACGGSPWQIDGWSDRCRAPSDPKCLMGASRTPPVRFPRPPHPTDGLRNPAIPSLFRMTPATLPKKHALGEFPGLPCGPLCLTQKLNKSQSLVLAGARAGP